MSKEEVMMELDQLLMLAPSTNYSVEAEEKAAALFSKLIPILNEKDSATASLVMRHPGVFVRPLARHYETKILCDGNIKAQMRTDLADKISAAEETNDDLLTQEALVGIADLLKG